jgi:ABC-type Fe3+ transport system permease subunit
VGPGEQPGRADPAVRGGEPAVHDLAAVRLRAAGAARAGRSRRHRRLRAAAHVLQGAAALLAPGLAAASIFTFRIAWNEFILALVLTDRHTRTLPVAASLFITDIGVDWGKVMAMGSLIAIPPLMFTFVAARQIIGGLTAGAVKG